MNIATRFAPVLDSTDSADPELHHGDLRKAAYLKRRAAYQMQASSSPAQQQAGAPLGKPPTAKLSE